MSAKEEWECVGLGSRGWGSSLPLGGGTFLPAGGRAFLPAGGSGLNTLHTKMEKTHSLFNNSKSYYNIHVHERLLGRQEYTVYKSHAR